LSVTPLPRALKDFLRISGNELELEYDMQW